MIDLEQKVKIKWSTVSKNRYIELGYNFTRKINEIQKSIDLLVNTEANIIQLNL